MSITIDYNSATTYVIAGAGALIGIAGSFLAYKLIEKRKAKRNHFIETAFRETKVISTNCGEKYKTCIGLEPYLKMMEAVKEGKTEDEIRNIGYKYVNRTMEVLSQYGKGEK